jgi:hypothetical protein
MAKLRIHYLIEAESVPAPHHESGSIPSPLGPIGTGKKYVCCCDPTIVLSDTERATGEPWAVGCIACATTERFQKDLALNPHPRMVARALEAEDITGCCG